MGVMDRVCAACQQAITEGQQWFRVREEFVHLACSEKFMRLTTEKRQKDKPAPT